MLPTMSSETKRKFQKNVTSPMTGVERLKRLPAEGWFLLAASFPLAAIFTWNVTYPLLTGSFGKNPVEVLKNFFNGISDLDGRLSICPTILTGQTKRFFDDQTTVQFKEEGWQDDIFTHKIKEPSVIRHENKEEIITDECDQLIDSPIINEISHWIDGKVIMFDKVRNYFQRPTDDISMCLGGKFHLPEFSEELKQISKLDKLRFLQENSLTQGGYIGTRHTETVLSNFHSCTSIVIIQVCGESLVKVRSLVKDPGSRNIGWSPLYSTSLLPGDLILLPRLSIATVKTDTVTGSFFNFSMNSKMESTTEDEHMDSGKYTFSPEVTDIFSDLNIRILDLDILHCLGKHNM